MDVPQKNFCKLGPSSEKRVQYGGSTSLMWVSWGHVCQQFLLAPFGEVRKSTRIPRTSMWILAKILRLPSLKKGHTVDGRNVAPVWHLCIYQTPLSIRILFFHNHQSHIWLITTEISQVPHTNNLFKGTSSTRKGRVFFGSGQYVTSYEGLLGLFLPF